MFFDKTSLPKIGPAYKEIGAQFRNAILNGELKVGSRIAPVQELARLYETSIFTIQMALQPLVKEGLLERNPRSGTFVRGETRRIGTIGVYFGADFLKNEEMAFYRELQVELLRGVEQANSRFRLWIDVRAPKRQSEILPEIKEALQAREIQGLIVGVANSLELKWISKLDLPVSYFGSTDLPGGVLYDPRQFFELGFQELQRLGCRTAGIIFNNSVSRLAEEEKNPGIKQFFSNFRARAADYGLQVKDNWFFAQPFHASSTNTFESFGYRQFRAIWNQAERPDGLLIYPDMAARGAMMAILEAGIAPKDLKLAIHQNEGLRALTPFPASKIVSSIRLAATVLIEQLLRQIDGRQVQPLHLPLAIEIQPPKEH